MTNVQFDEEPNVIQAREVEITSAESYVRADTPPLIKFLLRAHIVNTPRAGLYVLIGIIILCVGAILYLYNPLKKQEAQFFVDSNGKVFTEEEVIKNLPGRK